MFSPATLLQVGLRSMLTLKKKEMPYLLNSLLGLVNVKSCSHVLIPWENQRIVLLYVFSALNVFLSLYFILIYNGIYLSHDIGNPLRNSRTIQNSNPWSHYEKKKIYINHNKPLKSPRLVTEWMRFWCKGKSVDTFQCCPFWNVWESPALLHIT